MENFEGIHGTVGILKKSAKRKNTTTEARMQTRSEPKTQAGKYGSQQYIAV